MSRFSRDIALWVGSAAIVVAAHGGITWALTSWSDAADAGGAPTAIMIEMAPLSTESAAEHANLPVDKLQEEQTEPAPKPEEQKEPEKEPEQEQRVADLQPLPDPPPPLPADAARQGGSNAAARGSEGRKKPPPKKKVAIATAPERADRVAPRQRAAQAGAAVVSQNVMMSYAANVIRPHLLRHISSARLKDGGVVIVTFTITRQGRLTAKHVSRSSGHSEIDGEALSTLQRAQPYPAPPPELTQQQFVFTLPMRYNIR